MQVGVPGYEDEQKRVIAATVGELRIVNLYVVNGQDVGTDKYGYKLRWLEAVHDWLAEELHKHPRMIVLGDFNIAPDERDVHDPVLWNEAHILTSTAERARAEAAYTTWACTTCTARSTRRRAISAGGITGRARSGATWGCAST